MSRRRWAALAALAAAATGALWWAAGRQQPFPPAVTVPPGVAMEFEELAVRGRSAGGREWRLRARTVRVSADRTITTLQGIEQATFGLPGQAELTMSADRARSSSVTGNLEVTGRVHLVAAGGAVVTARGLRWLARAERGTLLGPVVVTLGRTRIETPVAHYRAASRTIECPGGVRVRGPDGELVGERLVVDLAQSEYRLAGEVRMRLPLAEAERTLARGEPPATLGRLGELFGKGAR